MQEVLRKPRRVNSTVDVAVTPDDSEPPPSTPMQEVAHVDAALAGAGSLRSALVALRDATARQATALEDGLGPYSDEVFTCGRHSDHIEEVRARYCQLSRRVAELCDADSVARSQVEDLCLRLAELAQRDTELVFDALWTDVGTGD